MVLPAEEQQQPIVRQDVLDFIWPFIGFMDVLDRMRKYEEHGLH